MGFDQIFRKSMGKNVRLPEIAILLQFGSENLANPSNFTTVSNVPFTFE